MEWKMGWELVDCSEALEEDEENPRVAIGSEEELREQLHRWQRRNKHAALMLDAPSKDSLTFSLGGEFGSLGWCPAPDLQRLQGNKEAVAEERVTDEPVTCWGEGIPNQIEPAYLFPADHVIAAVLFFYNTHQLPGWLSWREWNPESLDWEQTQPVSQRVTAS